MRVLLDTHAFLWWVEDVPTLSKKARTAIGDPGNECLLSLASCWEMAIKLIVGKLRLPSAIERGSSRSNLQPMRFASSPSTSAMLPGLRHCRFITVIRSTVCSLRRPSRSVA